MKHLIAALILVATATTSTTALSRVYKNKPIGKYNVSFDLRDYDGTFLNFMKKRIYPAIAKEAENTTGHHREFLSAIERGEGVEIRLTDDVTTLHVKFENPFDDKAERSGRSFGVVGNNKKNYIADASYAHFLRTIEKISKGSDSELETFYKAILSILANNDTSYINDLSRKSKQVAADFLAVYIAEQYRHMINGRDKTGDFDNIGAAKLGRGHNWDDAHLQVTLLAAFHGGQSKNYRYMVYEGELTDRVYDQNTCLYRRKNDPARGTTEMREIQLKDYWQFSYRSDCPGRSGVNITRSDFQKMGKLVSEDLNSRGYTVENLALELGESDSGNMFKKITKFFISNSAPKKLKNDGEDLVEAIVDFLMESHHSADAIIHDLTT